jgi:hypothetical protein
MNASPQRNLAAEPVKAWVARDDRIVQFLADDGSLYCSQHHALSAVSPGPDRLEVKAPPHGTLIITGPAARELCNCLCAGQATLIRTDGEEILSVEYVPEETEI